MVDDTRSAFPVADSQPNSAKRYWLIELWAARLEHPDIGGGSVVTGFNVQRHGGAPDCPAVR